MALVVALLFVVSPFLMWVRLWVGCVGGGGVSFSGKFVCVMLWERD